MKTTKEQRALAKREADTGKTSTVWGAAFVSGLISDIDELESKLAAAEAECTRAGEVGMAFIDKASQADVECKKLNRELSRLRLKWTGDVPKTCGQHWFRYEHGPSCWVVDMFLNADDELMVKWDGDNDELLADVVKRSPNCQWAGPIAEPGE